MTSAWNDHPSSLATALARTASLHGDRTALVELGGRELTWSELATEVNIFAHQLIAAGVQPGSPTVIRLGNRVEFVLAFFALVSLRCPVVPVDPALVGRSLEHILADSGSKHLLVDNTTRPSSVPDGVQVVTVEMNGGEPEGAPLDTNDNRLTPAAVLYTSGTTGRPKGVKLSTPIRASGSSFCYSVGRGFASFGPFIVGYLAADYGLGGGISTGLVAVLFMMALSLLLADRRGRVITAVD